MIAEPLRWCVWGEAYLALEEYEQAIADYERAIELDPKNGGAYYSRGFAYSELGEYKRAIADYDQAIVFNPKNRGAYYHRGFAYLWIRDAQQAKVDFSYGYVLEPTDMDVALIAEWAGMDKERSGTETAQRLEKIAEGNPQDYVAYVCRGVALGLQGRLKDGLVELEKAIPLDPEEWDAYFWKGMLCAYYYKGRYQQAAEAIEKALQVGLPPVLLTPLYWLEKDRLDFFEQYARPLLKKYGI